MLSRKSDENVIALFNDMLITIIGIVIVVVLFKFGLFELLIGSAQNYYIVASFVAGIFFTSIFTIAPASIALVSIAINSPIQGVVIFGALGAMFGDLILLFFIRDKFTEDLFKVIKKSTMKHILNSFHFGFMKYLSPLLGALIIASPLPDELGITLLGISKIKTAVLVPISLSMNALGIYVLISFYKLL